MVNHLAVFRRMVFCRRGFCCKGDFGAAGFLSQKSLHVGGFVIEKVLSMRKFCLSQKGFSRRGGFIVKGVLS